MSHLLPLFLDLAGRRVLLVGGGPSPRRSSPLLAAGADVRVVAPDVCGEIERSGVAIARRRFEPADLDGVWLVVAAATPEVNRRWRPRPRRAAFRERGRRSRPRQAFLSGVVRRDGVTLAISTSGAAPA